MYGGGNWLGKGGADMVVDIGANILSWTGMGHLDSFIVARDHI